MCEALSWQSSENRVPDSLQMRLHNNGERVPQGQRTRRQRRGLADHESVSRLGGGMGPSSATPARRDRARLSRRPASSGNPGDHLRHAVRRGGSPAATVQLTVSPTATSAGSSTRTTTRWRCGDAAPQPAPFLLGLLGSLTAALRLTLRGIDRLRGRSLLLVVVVQRAGFRLAPLDVHRPYLVDQVAADRFAALLLSQEMCQSETGEGTADLIRW
jgi:hypothetical protein